VIRIAPELLDRYSAPGPRYTSYPTVMHWGAAPAPEQWLASLAQTLDNTAQLALYVHIPFCQQLCTFCGCNMRLARNHAFAAPYVDTLLHEFDLYRKGLAGTTLRLATVHLGGGTPTYLPATELDRLLDGLLQHCTAASSADFTLEADPRNTSPEQLAVLRKHGFNRLSIGVQDFDARVLEMVNRVQTVQQVQRVLDDARTLGFTSISVDLIHGLPLQTPDGLASTFDILDRMQPDRVSFLPYAHVPWIKPSQRRYTEADLPDRDVRHDLLTLGRARLEAMGMIEIGFDQYARSNDSLALALSRGGLQRSFMGFSAVRTQALIGLGVSAIGATPDAYAQNEKGLQLYEAAVASGRLPLQRGHLLTAEDAQIRGLLWQLFAGGPGTATPTDHSRWWGASTPAVEILLRDGLMERDGAGLRVTPLGRALLRHVGRAFDQHLRAASPALRAAG
jgi:oxygen-independent coproporphyrinogen-3 oxidase